MGGLGRRYGHVTTDGIYCTCLLERRDGYTLLSSSVSQSIHPSIHPSIRPSKQFFHAPCKKKPNSTKSHKKILAK